MTKNWLLTIRTNLRDGSEKISRSPMICDEPITQDEAMAVAASQFGEDRVLSVEEKQTKKACV